MRALVMDLRDYEEQMKEWVQDNKSSADMVVYEINGPGKRSVLMTNKPDNPDPFTNNPKAIELIAVAKFMGGQVPFYDKQERDAIIALLNAHIDQKEEIRKMYEGVLLRSEQRDAYNESSPIYNFFHPKVRV
jgi:hypothetical protein